MSHIVLAFKSDSNKGTVVFQGTLEAAQEFQWSSANAAGLIAQGFTTWQLARAGEK